MDSSTFNDALWKEQEVELINVGKRLLSLPSSTYEILILLEEAESILARVYQGIPRSKVGALRPVMTAMITGELLRNADLNIQVAVASCFSEITRITAPTFPYPDDQMKEIFQLFIVALKQLSTDSGINFVRAQQILEHLANVRSCMIMLDIEIEAMIVEMFQLFLNTIRSNHSSDIFNHMETIMTIIIKESDEVPLELLRPLLDSVRNDNKETSPISWEMGKNVFEKCATKLQPYLREAVKALNLKVDDYGEIIASLCQDTSSGKNMVSKLDEISEAGQEDCTPQVKDGNESDDKNPMENSAEIVQSEENTCAHRRKRVIKSNSLIRPEEGYELTWTRGDQGSSKVSCVRNNKEKDLLLPLKPGKANMPSDSSLRKSGYDNKVVFGKRGRSKKVESRKKIKREIISEKDESKNVDKIEESPLSKLAKAMCPGDLAPEKEETSNRANVEYGEEMVNVRIMVWWPLDKTFYTGTVEAYDPSTKKHKIKYDDDEEEVLNLREERWELFNERPRQIQSSQKQEADHPSLSKEPVETLKEIAKRKAGSSKKQEAFSSPKREGRSLVKSEYSALGFIRTRDEDDETCEANFSSEVGNSRAVKKVSKH